MPYSPNDLRLQAFFLVLLIASVAAGVLGLVGHLWPGLIVPESLQVPLDRALRIALAGPLLATLIFHQRSWQRVIGLALCSLALYRIVLSIENGETGAYLFGSHLALPNLLSLSAFSLGIVGLLGLRGRFAKGYALAVGVAGGLLGAAILWQFARFVSTERATAASGSLLFAGVFCLCYGIILSLLVRRPPGGKFLLSRNATIVGSCAIAGTFGLALLAGWASHAERHNTAAAILRPQAAIVEHELASFVSLIQRLAHRWVALDLDVPTPLQRADIASYFTDVAALETLYVSTKTGVDGLTFAKTPQARQWLTTVIKEPATRHWIQNAEENQLSVSWMFPDLDKPFNALLLVVAEQTSKGIFIVSVDIQLLLRDVLLLNHENFPLAIEPPLHNAETPLITHDHGHDVYERIAVPLPNGPALHLSAAAAPPSPASLRGALAPGLFLLGLFVSYFLVMGRNLITVQKAQVQELLTEEERFRSLFFQTPDAVFEFDLAGTYQSLNALAQTITGITSADLGTLNYRELLSQDVMSSSDFEKFDAAFNRTLQGYASTFEVVFRNVDGRLRNYECAFVPILIRGKVRGVFAVVKDVTERVRVRENQRILEKSLESAASAVMVIDIRLPDMPVVYANAALTQMTGYTTDELLGVGLKHLPSPIPNAEDIDKILQAIAAGDTRTITLKGIRRDGAPFWNQVSAVPVRNEKGEVTHVTAIMNDISEKKDQENRLAFQATHDALTGLGNRSLFEDRLAHDFAVARRSNGRLAVLFIDLDHFKPVNDALGHKVGDEVLITIARRLENSIRSSDTLARLGGDEFVLLVPDARSSDEIEEMASRILEAVSQPLQVNEHELHISASIGISLLDDDLEEPAKLLQQADMAMYKAKRQGRDTYELYSKDLDNKLARRLSLRNELQEAIRTHQLRLWYQPQVNQHGTFCGLEALVRWEHPVKGIISPKDFIPLAEDTGQIIALGKWVLNQACSDTLRLMDRGIMRGRMAVNISPLQFRRPAFLTTLRDLLGTLALPASFLELELTESILMRNSEDALDTLETLAGMGVSTSIDDFGTGYSSLRYLKELPVHRVKIDKSFVDQVIGNPKDAAICKGVITMAGELGMAVVAEGVETRGQYERLVEYGCQAFQGFYFARPMAYSDLTQWIDNNLRTDEKSA